MKSILLKLTSRYWGIVALLLLWQAGVSVTHVNSIVLPRPIDVLRDIVSEPGLFLENGAQTFLLAAAGLMLGMIFGTMVAILAWSSSLLAGILTPLALLFASVPVVALIPILARVLGYDMGTVLAIVVIITSFPAYVFTSAGLTMTPPGSKDLFRVLGASGWTRFLWLVAPSALPNWMIALRLAAPPAILAAMVAEFLMGTSGLGSLLRTAASDLRSDRAFGTSAVATVISVTCFGLAVRAERAVLNRWS